MSSKQMTLACLISLTLMMTIVSPGLVSAFPGTIREKTFTTYVDPIGIAGTDSYNEYGYGGIHWKTGTHDITYMINLSGAPSGAKDAVKAAFETWDNQVTMNLFDDNVGTITRIVGSKYDGKNVVSWGKLGKGIIAQTTVWYNPKTLEIVEFGMVFNTAYKWGIDSDGEGGTTLVGKFDVQDIATHEAGHTLMLDDLYDTAANQLTMYGYGDYGQTYARSLGAGDISGILAIYQ
jgi:hypothetical protein